MKRLLGKKASSSRFTNVDRIGNEPGFVGFLNRVREFWGLLTQQSA